MNTPEEIAPDPELDSLLAKAYEKLNELQKRLIPLQEVVTSDRNKPCPCGSNKKAKKCCNTPDKTSEYLRLRNQYAQILSTLSSL